MKPLIKRPEIFSLGLDIGSYLIKTAKLRFLPDNQVELSNFSLEPNQLDPASILVKIKESQGQTEVNTSISGSATVIRYIAFPRMNSSELNQSLKFEAQKHIPFSIEQVNLDAHILKEDLPQNKMLVLIAAAKKDLVSQRMKLMQDAGFKVNILSIDSIALANAFNFNYKEDEDLNHKTIALLNIGATLSNLNIMEGGLPRLSRDIHVGGKSFTQRIMDVFDIDFKSAEELKVNPGKQREKSKELASALEPVYSNLAGSIRTSFDYYESQSASSVAKIFLSGGSSRFSGLKDTLENLLGLGVEYWNPIKNIKLAQNIDEATIVEASSFLTVAIGLALADL